MAKLRAPSQVCRRGCARVGEFGILRTRPAEDTAKGSTLPARGRIAIIEAELSSIAFCCREHIYVSCQATRPYVATISLLVLLFPFCTALVEPKNVVKLPKSTLLRRWAKSVYGVVSGDSSVVFVRVGGLQPTVEYRAQELNGVCRVASTTV